MITAVRARWALIEPSRIGLASSAGLPDADDRFLYRLRQHYRWNWATLALISATSAQTSAIGLYLFYRLYYMRNARYLGIGSFINQKGRL